MKSDFNQNLIATNTITITKSKCLLMTISELPMKLSRPNKSFRFSSKYAID